MIKFYYGPENEVLETYRVLPAPQISIKTQLDYANDSVIGYTYVITINGTVSTYQQTQVQNLLNGEVYDMCTGDNLTTENEQVLFGEGDTITYSFPPDQNLTGLIGRIEAIKAIFLRNGSSLTIRDSQNNNLLKAKGGILRSINFDQSNNNWVSTCPYSVEIEFNELELLSESFGCSNPFFNDNPGLIDTVYHIKSYSDKWNFDISEDYNSFVYESGKLIPIDSDTFNITGGVSIWNPSIKLTYNISAVGKHYFDADGPGPNEKVVPAWLQAKNFAQERLYNQVNYLASVLRIANSRCDVDELFTLNNIYQNTYGSPLTVGTGLIENLISDPVDPYNVYDETISCSVSESEGSFSLDYSCILKRDIGIDYSEGNVKHTCNKTINKSFEGQKQITTISVDGQVEGLVRGGIVSIVDIYKNIDFNANGSLFSENSLANKYSVANTFLSKILNTSLTDLKDDFKTDLKITAAELGLSDIAACSASSIKPTRFNLTRDFTNGTISYNAEYSSLNSCIKESADGTIFNTKITIDEPVPVLAELPVPNGNYIIQDIGTVTARRISITCEGRKLGRDCCEVGISSFIGNAMTQNIEQLFPFISLPNPALYTLTTKNFNYDLLMNSYSINLSYICTPGCSI